MQTINIEFSAKELDVIDTARLLYEKKTKQLNSIPEFIKLLTLKLSVDIIGGDISFSNTKRIHVSYKPLITAKKQRKDRIALFTEALKREIKYNPKLILSGIKQIADAKISKKRQNYIKRLERRKYKRIKFAYCELPKRENKDDAIF